jgi:murein DD-endopeptidase MepM/ murein hydrolase activator NlpD
MRAPLLACLALLPIVTGVAAESVSDATDGDELAAVARAADGVLERARPADRPRRKRDPRFSDGPRRVPEARGAARQRALALGIGGLEATRRLLRSVASPELLAAARGHKPRDLLWPVLGGHWGRGFGYTRKHNSQLRHDGVDIGAPTGAVVRAAADGLVVYSDNTLKGYGNAVIVLHPNGWTTLYAHNSRNTVQPGWRVKRAERIALVGSTGLAWGPHLHFELRKDGKLADPARHFVGHASQALDGPLVELALDARGP